LAERAGGAGALGAPSWRREQEEQVLSVLPLGGESRESRTKLYDGWKGIKQEDFLDSFLSFVLNLLFVSSIQNLTAINHESLDKALHTSDTIEATSLPTSA
jgi:hypothetical protein